MKGFLVLLFLVATVRGESVYDYEDQPIDLIEKHIGQSTFSVEAKSRDYDVTPVSSQRNFVENLIKDTLDGLRDVVINGNDNLPPLDPFVVPQYGPVDFSETAVRASVTATNVRMEGLQWYTVDEVDFNLLRLAFGLKMTMPWINFSSGYNARVRLALLITHNAGGNIRVFVNRLEVGVDGRLGTNILGGGHLTLRNFNLKISIGDVQIRVDGLTGSSLVNNIINSYVQNLTRDVIQNQLENISEQLSDEIFDIVNDLLASYTLDDLLNLGS